MKKKYISLILLVVLVAVLLVLGHAIVRKAGELATLQERLEQLPAFSFTDLGGKAFSHGHLSDGKPVLLIYFHPDCDHCQYEAGVIRDSLHRLAATEVLLISSAPAPQLEEFGEAYGLLGHPGVHILHDAAGAFHTLFGSNTIPSVFIYNRKRALVRHFKGETKIEAILKYLYDDDGTSQDQ